MPLGPSTRLWVNTGSSVIEGIVIVGWLEGPVCPVWVIEFSHKVAAEAGSPESGKPVSKAQLSTGS
ncbi:MAG: hypothetical protein IPL41_03415 [Micropruina sp.]|nr:hypothetical protein [Micropruina sp.]